MSITGGLSWEDALSPLRNASPVAVIFMVVYIVMTVFAADWRHGLVRGKPDVQTSAESSTCSKAWPTLSPELPYLRGQLAPKN